MSSTFATVEVVGAGLIGTSIALKVVKNGGLARTVDVNASNQRIANQLMGSSLLPAEATPDCVIAATPVDVLPQVIFDALCRYPRAMVIDTGSVKTKVIHEVSTLCRKLSNTSGLARYLPTHPMAGREFSGPSGARSDLFEARAWAITAHDENGSELIELARNFVEEMGANSYLLSPQDHDKQVALTSHLPQLLASALAGALSAPGGASKPLELAGQGLRDMTRLASSEPTIWGPILEANADALSPLVDEIAKSINLLKNKNFDRETVLSFMQRGAEGVHRIPGKHGGISRDYGALSVVIPDQAGQLAALFNHCADIKINIEDLQIEHSPGQETGLITLYVQSGDLSTLENHLSTLGWQCTAVIKNH